MKLIFRCVKDSTYAALVPSAATSMTKAFSMEAFNFASNGTAAVYIHGVVKICDKNEANFATYVLDNGMF